MYISSFVFLLGTIASGNPLTPHIRTRLLTLLGADFNGFQLGHVHVRLMLPRFSLTTCNKQFPWHIPQQG
jgi:hypothetical protein